MCIRLTPKGKKIVDQAEEIKREKINFVVKKISSEDRQFLFKIIKKLIAAIEQEKEASLK